MTVIKISEKTYIALYPEYVNIRRASVRGDRSLCIPRSLAEFAVQNVSVVDQLSPGFMEPNTLETNHVDWKIVKSLFRSKIYLGFAMYINGQRQGYVLFLLLLIPSSHYSQICFNN